MHRPFATLRVTPEVTYLNRTIAGLRVTREKPKYWGSKTQFSSTGREAMRKLVLLFLLVPAFAWAQAPEAPIMKADRDFNAATQQRRLDGWMEFMADDVVSDRKPPLVGKEAMRAAMMKQWSNPDFHLAWEPTKGEMFPDGSMGYTTGRWTRTSKDDSGKTVELHGNYLTVWKKQADGSYKVAWDGGAVDPKPAPKTGEKK